MLILGFILIGMVAGGVAQYFLRKGRTPIDWTEAFVAGLIGSFVFGTLISFLAGDGFDLRISGLIGSTIGAIIVLAIWYPIKARYYTKAPPTNTVQPRKK